MSLRLPITRPHVALPAAGALGLALHLVHALAWPLLPGLMAHAHAQAPEGWGWWEALFFGSLIPPTAAAVCQLRRRVVIFRV